MNIFLVRKDEKGLPFIQKNRVTAFKENKVVLSKEIKGSSFSPWTYDKGEKTLSVRKIQSCYSRGMYFTDYKAALMRVELMAERLEDELMKRDSYLADVKARIDQIKGTK